MTKSGGVICKKYIVLFFYKKSINAKLRQKNLIHNLCNPKVCRIFVGGFFIKKNKFDNPHFIYYIFIYGRHHLNSRYHCRHSGGNDLVHKKSGRSIISPHHIWPIHIVAVYLWYGKQIIHPDPHL